MGFYERHVFPWLADRMTSRPEILAIKKDALQSASGRVVEIGFGTGSSVSLYPAGVESIVGIEPSAGMHDRLKHHLGAARVPVETVVGDAEGIPLPDQSVDTAVSLLTLCTVPHPDRALAELRRVLKDAGRLIVVEHGLTEDPGVAKWQHRLNGLNKVVACGCNLNRPVSALVEGAGFHFETVRRFYMDKAPRAMGWVTVGTAAKLRQPHSA
jgi:ubiquinone/menaquinone biosynthesis C-methylase UbiE